MRAAYIDGSRMLKTPEDQENENKVAAAIEAAWQVELRAFGFMSPIDWYAIRQGRLIGVVELKSRSHGQADYSTVFLSVRKWLTLLLAAEGLGVPALYVIRFTDGIRWVRIADVDPRRLRIGGRAERRGHSETEPLIEVPVNSMKTLDARGTH